MMKFIDYYEKMESMDLLPNFLINAKEYSVLNQPNILLICKKSQKNVQEDNQANN
jgi:deoxyadenosine/deoxycytidine kinase